MSCYIFANYIHRHMAFVVERAKQYGMRMATHEEALGLWQKMAGKKPY